MPFSERAATTQCRTQVPMGFWGVGAFASGGRGNAALPTLGLAVGRGMSHFQSDSERKYIVELCYTHSLNSLHQLDGRCCSFIWPVTFSRGHCPAWHKQLMHQHCRHKSQTSRTCCELVMCLYELPSAPGGFIKPRVTAHVHLFGIR